MNRIAELKALATENIMGIDILNAEKFAQLIVQECVTAIMGGDRYRKEYFADRIYRHFEEKA